MVLDTTNCDTGRLRRTFITFQNSPSKQMLWLACRHYVLVLLIIELFCFLAIEKKQKIELEVLKKLRSNKKTFMKILVKILFNKKLL